MIQNMGKHYVFVDERGSPTLKDPTPYVLLGIFIHEDKLEQAQIQIDKVAREMFSGGEIKSSKIGSDHNRRIKVLHELKKIDFKYIALIVDKNSLTEGFNYRRSFVKFVHKFLYQRISNWYGNIEVICDEHGNKDFMKSFKKYFQKSNIDDLFSNSFEHSFQDSKNQRLIQLADVIAGTTYSQYIDNTISKEFVHKYHEILNPKKLAIALYPPHKQIDWVSEFEVSGEHNNQVIAKKMIAIVQEFIDKNNNNFDEDTRAQIIVLNTLLKEAISQKSVTPYFAYALMEVLNTAGLFYGKRAFTSRVIGQLRNKGIVITGTKKGYKLALGIDDVQGYLNHDASLIFPMLYRLKKANETFFVHTDMNIFQDEKHQILEQLINKVDSVQIEKHLSKRQQPK